MGGQEPIAAQNFTKLVDGGEHPKLTAFAVPFAGPAQELAARIPMLMSQLAAR